MKLPRHPAHGLSKLRWDIARLRASHLCEHHSIAIALDELHRNIEVQQTGDCFIWHRPGKHIAPNHYLIYFCLTNVLQHSLKCWKIRMNVIDCTDRHDRASSIGIPRRIQKGENDSVLSDFWTHTRACSARSFTMTSTTTPLPPP